MIWGAIVGGVAGTVVLTTLLRAASELGLTRIDLPFLLGTAVTTDRVRAKAVGYALHFVFGLLFTLAYYAIFVVIGTAGVLLGALFGLVHALFAGTALVNVLLPVVHPRMGTGFDAAGSAPLLEPPGFMLLNYGARRRSSISSPTSPTAPSSAASSRSRADEAPASSLLVPRRIACAGEAAPSSTPHTVPLPRA